VHKSIPRVTSPPLDLAVQFVYQQTSLSNRVGVTAAELEADAVIMNGNVLSAGVMVEVWGM